MSTYQPSLLSQNDRHLLNPNTDSVSYADRPYVSLLVPAYNESTIILQNLEILCNHMRGLEEFYEWELVVVNDGSKDDTAIKAEAFARRYDNVRVIHHRVNSGLGRAFKTGTAREITSLPWIWT
jgi:glycosyltransferase involved in cell wall biosynthesis